MLRVLRPGGTLVLTCPNRAWRWTVADRQRASTFVPTMASSTGPAGGCSGDGYMAHGGTLDRHVGIHVFPFILTFTHLMLRRLDRFGTLLGPAYVNQGLAAVKGTRR